MLIRAPRTLTSKLNVYIGAATCALLIITVWVSYYTSRSLVENQTNDEAMKQVHSLAEKMDEFVLRIAEIPNGIAAHQQDKGSEPTKGMVVYLSMLLNNTPLEDAQSVYIAFEQKNWKEPDAMIRVDRQSWPHSAPAGDDFHDPKREGYNGP